MKNTKNAAIITFNSGGSLVEGIQLLFKESTTNNIKVIEYLDKSNLGYSNDTDYTYTFDNSKIFTLLPDSELLRLYDNVPIIAKAQTIMGNRVVYGNYKEGYDLKDKFGNDIKLEFYGTKEMVNIHLASFKKERKFGYNLFLSFKSTKKRN